MVYVQRNTYLQSISDSASPDLIDKFTSYMKPNGSILDVGCAAGRDSKIFTTKKFQTTGIDIVAVFIQNARSKFPKITFNCADVRQLPFSTNYFHGIWAHASLVHLTVSDMQIALQECNRVLKSKGILHLSLKKVRSREDSKSDQRTFTYWTEESLTVQLKSAGFTLLEPIETRVSKSREDLKWLSAFSEKQQ